MYDVQMQYMAHVKSYLISHHAFTYVSHWMFDSHFVTWSRLDGFAVCLNNDAYGWSLISHERKLCQQSVCLWCDLTCLQKTHILGQSIPLMTVESCILSLWSATCLEGRGRAISLMLHLWEGSISPTYWKRVWTFVSCFFKLSLKG